MTKPVVGAPTWGDTLNLHLDTLQVKDALGTDVAATGLFADATAQAALQAAVDGRLSNMSLAATYVAPIGKSTSGPVAPVPEFNARNYGAVGDGVADDATAIQAALNAAAALVTGSASKASVVLPHGEYRITTGLTIAANVTLRGMGWTASVLAPVGAITAVTVSALSTVADLRIRASGGAVTAGSVGVTATGGTSTWTLDHVQITYMATGVALTNTYITRIDNCKLNICTIGLATTGTDNNAITMTGGEIQACTGAGVQLGGAGVLAAFSGVTIQGNAGGGIKMTSASLNSVAVRDCYFELNGSAHIETTATCRALTVEGNSFTGNVQYAIRMSNGVETVVQGNSFQSTHATPQTMSFAAAVARTFIGTNYYGTGAAFVPATDYLGTDLRLLNADGLWTKRVRLANGSLVLDGTGFPEAVETAPAGSIYARTNGLLYAKTTGSGNTGWALLRPVTTATTAALAALGDTINTSGKATGSMVFNTTTSKPVWATGSAAASTWVDATGTVAHTPV